MTLPNYSFVSLPSIVSIAFKDAAPFVPFFLCSILYSDLSTSIALYRVGHTASTVATPSVVIMRVNCALFVNPNHSASNHTSRSF